MTNRIKLYELETQSFGWNNSKRFFFASRRDAELFQSRFKFDWTGSIGYAGMFSEGNAINRLRDTVEWIANTGTPRDPWERASKIAPDTFAQLQRVGLFAWLAKED